MNHDDDDELQFSISNWLHFSSFALYVVADLSWHSESEIGSADAKLSTEIELFREKNLSIRWMLITDSSNGKREKSCEELP